MKDKKIWNIIQVIFFLLILGAGTGAVVFGACEGKTYSELEKRELAAFPDVEAGSIFSGEFESDFTEALSDHICGRDLFVTAKTAVQVFLGRSEIDNIFIDGERLIELYHDSDFDEKQIRSNISDLTGFMAQVANGVGAEHVKLMLIPSKYTLYREQLPSYVPVSARADAVADEIRERLAEWLAEGATEAEPDESEEEVSEGEPGEDEGFDFDAGDPDAEEEDPDDIGFDFDAGDPDAESDEDLGKDMGFDFDEGDPDAESDGTEDDFDGDETDAEVSEETDADTQEKTSAANLFAGLTDAERSEKAREIAEQMVIDLKPVLAPHTSEYIYYLTDHHWTTLGALYAYQEWRDRQADISGDDMASIPSRAVADDFLGTDYNRIHYYKKADVINRYDIPEADAADMEINDSGDMNNKDSIYDEEALKTADKYNYFFSGNYSAITVNTAAESDKTLLIVKDSYSNSLVPFLCRDYKKIIMVDLRYVNSSIYDYLPEGEKPDDILVVYNEEKFMQDTHQLYLR